jgi:coenzyme F420-reducing hydrogenase beta subunit
MNNVSEISHEKCCGCAVCTCCPQKAIGLREDEFGFRFPIVDETKCINCGACIRVCPTVSQLRSSEQQKVYAARSNDKDVLSTSSSGGMCYEIGKWMLARGGVVCGAAWDDNMTVKHIVVEDMEGLHRLQGSKYVQSNCDDIYKQVKDLIQSGKEVLFVGTPCQVNAIKNYIGKENHNLYTIDIICHGVPNQKMFQDYLKCLGEKKDGKVVGFTFRDKKKGWGTTGKAEINRNKETITVPIYKTEQSYYYYYYLQGILSRESCYHCDFANTDRVGDITLGDYWGIEKVHPDVKNTASGVSLVIANNEKGNRILDLLENVKLWESDINSAIIYNGQLVQPQRYDRERDNILKLYTEYGYSEIDDYFNKNIGWKKYIDRIKQYIPRTIIQMMKKIR